MNFRKLDKYLLRKLDEPGRVVVVDQEVVQNRRPGLHRQELGNHLEDK